MWAASSNFLLFHRRSNYSWIISRIIYSDVYSLAIFFGWSMFLQISVYNLTLLLVFAAGSINVSNILTGKCLAKVKASNSGPVEDECNCSSECSGDCRSKKRAHGSRIRSTVAEALEDITALFYDEERNEIYTGNRHGLVHVWSN